MRQTKTLERGIAIQITDVAPSGGDGPAWLVHDVERGRAFNVALPTKALTTTPPGAGALGRAFTQPEIDDAIGLAVERALLTPPEKEPGMTYRVDVTEADLYDGVTRRQQVDRAAAAAPGERLSS